MLSKLTENSYNEDDKTFISCYVPSLTTEQNTSLTSQDNNQIYNRACVPDKNEQILEKEHSRTTQNLTTDHSLAIELRNEKKMHACSTCSKVFRIVSKLRIHEQSHSEERLHSCKICAKPFKFKSGLSRHMKQQHSGIDTKKPEASLCDELQELEYASLQDDEEQQSFEEENLTRIRTSSWKTKLVNKAGNDKCNFVNLHSDKTDLEASTCAKSLFSHEDESLDRGDDYFKNIVSQNDRCQSKETTCNISDKLNLNKSDEDDLEQNDPYEEVSKISVEFFPNPLASVTMQSCVENKVFKCQECPRTFEKPSRLEIHRRSHSDEKIFNCELCFQTFKYKGSLNRHIREQHYGQGRKSLSSALDVKQRNQEESYFSVGESRFDRYLTDVTESGDGVFRHWKERHYSQERISLSMVCEPVKREDFSSSLEKKDFKNAKCLDESLEDEVTGRLKQQDVSSKSFSKTVDKTELNQRQNCPPLEENECQNNESEKDECSREISDEGDSNSNVMRDEGQDSSLDNSRNNSNLEEHQIQRRKKQLMKCNETEDDMRSMSSQNEENIENVDDMRECESYENEENIFEENNSDFEENNLSMVFHHRQRDTENWKFDENYFESSKQEERDVSNSESNLEESSFEKELSKFVVTSKEHEDFKRKALVNMKNHGVGKIYRCDVCEKVFAKRSTWSNHKRTHNDDMSYACEICWKYFKYKGSLSRHIKEQHYGLGRKDPGNYNISNSSWVRDYLHKESKSLVPNMNEVESESPGNNNSSSNKECSTPINLDTSGTVLIQPDKRTSDLNARSMTFDKTPRGDTPCSSTLGSAVNDSKVDYEGSNFAAEKDAEIDDVKDKSSGVKRDGQNNDEALLTAANLYVTKKEDLKESECLQNAELETGASDIKQSESDLSDDKLQNSPVEITCEVCGRYFKHKGSLKRHVIEQHYGLGRKSFKTSVDVIQKEVDCSKAMAIDEEADGCTNGSSSCTMVMASFSNQSNENCCSSPAKLSPQDREGLINLGKTVNDVLQNDDSFRKETFEPKRSYFEMKSGEHSQMDEVDGKHESFEEIDFQLKKASEHNVLRPSEDLKKKNDNAQVNLNESDQELSNLDTRQEDFDSSDGNFKQLNTRKENQSHAKKGKKCKKANFFACDECPKVLPNRALLRKHKRVHSSEMSFTCEICHQTFKYKGSLSRHVKEQHYGLGRKGIRNMLDERTETDNDCLSVESVYNPKSTVCKDNSFEEQHFELKEKRLATKQVGNYINSTTSKTWKFSMQQCDKFEHNSQHGEDTNFENKQENFLHNDGPDLTKSKIEQKQNVDTKQSEFSSYRAELFEKTKMHKCPECPKLFWNIFNLREHAYKHTNIKYFACGLCAKAFKFRSGLVRHKRKEHKKHDNIHSESKAGVIDENGSGEDAALEQNRSSFETEDCSMFCEQVELNKGLKKQFSEGTRDCETVVGGRLPTEKLDRMYDEKAFANKDSASDFEKDVESNELINSFETDIGERSEVEKDCLNFEIKKPALKDELQSLDVGAKGFTKRSFLEVEKDKTTGNEEENFTSKNMSTRQNLTVKKKSAMYNCNKCDAVFKQLCDFLTHQSIHK